MITSIFHAADYLKLWTPIPGDPIDRIWAARTYQDGGPAFTVRHDGQIIACGGFVTLWPGVAQAWCLIAPLWHTQLGRTLHFAVAREIDAQIRVRGLRRIEADVDVANPLAMRWMKCLRFRLEAIRPLRGPNGETLAHYARLGKP